MSTPTWMIGWKADANCRNCDGTGVFYGNVCPCGCLTSEADGRSPTTDEFVEMSTQFEKENEL